MAATMAIRGPSHSRGSQWTIRYISSFGFSTRFRPIVFAFRSSPSFNDRWPFSWLENVQQAHVRALPRLCITIDGDATGENVDPNLPRRNCFSRGFSRVVVFFFFASAVGHRWGSIMLESLKASLFLFSFFFSSPPSFWKKRHPLLLLVAPRNLALPYQIFISPTKGERKRERIPLFVHRIVFSLSNFVRS